MARGSMRLARDLVQMLATAGGTIPPDRRLHGILVDKAIPSSALVALMFGTRWFATLYGFAFVSHQVGGFLGVWLGGVVFEQFGSYTPLWWLSVLFGVLSALINLPIVEQPVARPVAQPA